VSGENPFFSIITPCWNRGHLLERVHQSLSAQSFNNFEWILANDGSTDDTKTIAQVLLASNEIKTQYIEANKRVGKLRIDNAAISRARGKLLLWCDSDDYLLPDALRTLYEEWADIPVYKQSSYCGLTAIASTSEGDIFNPLPQLNNLDTTWNDIFGLYAKNTKNQDMVLCVRTDLMKSNPFPEVDFVAPEGVIWTKLGNMRTRLISKPIKFVEYGHTGAISHSNKMEYNRGRAVALAQIFLEMKKYHTAYHYTITSSVNYYRYAIHGDIRITDARKSWPLNENHLLNYFFVFTAILLCLKDRFQNKVIKTHKEFELNSKSAKISCSNNYE
jgi:glycosyltransferase involved in cell wall biosynthesis